jgi:acetylornithine deacetylase/succinyl-diaminopimelate desuccinylase-like protein
LQFPISDRDYTSLVGVAPTGGEAGLAMPVRRGLRPTVEVNGITSGYQGEGSKTIIPSWASVKLSCRLIAGQDPEQVLQGVLTHLKAHCPEELSFEVVHQHASGGALRVSSESPIIETASKILQQITGAEPLYIWEGASIPLIAALHTAAGATPLLVGFGLEEDNIHAPNESFSLEQFRKGFLFCAKLLMHAYE